MTRYAIILLNVAASILCGALMVEDVRLGWAAFSAVQGFLCAANLACAGFSFLDMKLNPDA